MTGGAETARPAGLPALEIVAGHPRAEDVAAVTLALSAVLTRESAARAERAARDANGTGGWADRSRLLHAPLAHGPHAWRYSGRPR